MSSSLGGLGIESGLSAGRIMSSLDVVSRSFDLVLGSLDAVKVRSSMTLFLRAAPDEFVFREVLDRFFDGIADPATDVHLAGAV
jgi:uncharacterized protein (DUF1810 family)